MNCFGEVLDECATAHGVRGGAFSIAAKVRETTDYDLNGYDLRGEMNHDGLPTDPRLIPALTAALALTPPEVDRLRIAYYLREDPSSRSANAS